MAVIVDALNGSNPRVRKQASLVVVEAYKRLGKRTEMYLRGCKPSTLKVGQRLRGSPTVTVGLDVSMVMCRSRNTALVSVDDALSIMPLACLGEMPNRLPQSHAVVFRGGKWSRQDTSHRLKTMHHSSQKMLQAVNTIRCQLSASQ